MIRNQYKPKQTFTSASGEIVGVGLSSANRQRTIGKMWSISHRCTPLKPDHYTVKRFLVYSTQQPPALVDLPKSYIYWCNHKDLTTTKNSLLRNHSKKKYKTLENALQDGGWKIYNPYVIN